MATSPCTICSATLFPGQTTYCSTACKEIGQKAKEAATSKTSGLPHSSAKIREIMKTLGMIEARGAGEKTISERFDIFELELDG